MVTQNHAIGKCREKDACLSLRRVRSFVNTIGMLLLYAAIGPFSVIAQTISETVPLLITAERLTYDIDGQRIIAEGNVEITQEGRTLLADRITYNRIESSLEAQGNITLLEPTGEAFFAEHLVLDEDFANGFVSGLGILLQDDSRIAARSGSRTNGHISVFRNAVYSPCEICQDESAPLWQIRAKEVIHDQTARTVTYQHARFELYGVPVAYVPYFSHPDPTVERRTGFLAPSFGTDSELGFTLEVPYHIVLSPSRDITLTPVFTTQGGTVITGELRDLQSFGRTDFKGSGTFTDAYERNPNDDSSQEFRGHIDSKGRYRVAKNVSAGFDINLASDNTYLQRYDISNDDVLQNRGYLELVDGLKFASLNAYGFQGLRDFDEQGRIPIVLPWLKTHYVSEPWHAGSNLTLDTDALALTRSTGLDMRRLSMDGGWEVGKVGGFGEVWRARANLRGDLYQIDGQSEDLGEGNSSTEARILPRVTLDLRWPLVAQAHGWQHLVEPIIVGTSTVDDGNRSDIPNEDSIDFEFDDTNLFEADRFTGLDLYDGGTRLSYGIAFQSSDQTGTRFDGLVGQSLRLRGDAVFPEGSGVDSSLSDYIGRFSADVGEFLRLNYRFRLDHEDIDFRRNDVRLLFGPPRLKLSLGYLNLSEEVTLDEPLEREELNAGIRVRLTEGLAAGFQSRIDLTESQPIAHMLGIVYTDDCFVITGGLERRFTTRGEISDQTRLTVRIGLKTLGEVNTSSDDLEQ